MSGANGSIMQSGETIFGEVRRNWGWLLALGVIFILLGIAGLGATFALTLASVVFFGVLLLAGGILQLVDGLKCKGWKSVLWHLLIAALYVLAGISVVANPLGASLVLTAMLGSVIVAIGLVRLVIAIQMRGTANWGWTLLAGIISILLGALILARWPASGLWVIGLFVAVELIAHGWSYVFISLAARPSGQQTASQPAPSEQSRDLLAG